MWTLTVLYPDVAHQDWSPTTLFLLLSSEVPDLEHRVPARIVLSYTY